MTLQGSKNTQLLVKTLVYFSLLGSQKTKVNYQRNPFKHVGFKSLISTPLSTKLFSKDYARREVLK